MSTAGLPPSVAAWLQNRAPDLLAVTAAALLAGKLAFAASHWLAGAAHHAPAGTLTPLSIPRLDSQSLLSAHLFGTAPVAQGPVQVSSAPLVLTGTMATPDPKHGWAIIGENALSAHLFAAGTTMPSGIRLLEVYSTQVFIERNGTREVLELPHTAIKGSNLPLGNANLASTAPIAESVKMMAQDSALIGQVMRPQPVFANGQLHGIRLYPGTDRNKFSQLGLQPGDLVTAVNNVPISDAQHGVDILRNLGSAPQATITVERGGATQQITIDSAKLNSVAGSAAADPSNAGPNSATTTGPASVAPTAPGSPPPTPD